MIIIFRYLPRRVIAYGVLLACVAAVKCSLTYWVGTCLNAFGWHHVSSDAEECSETCRIVSVLSTGVIEFAYLALNIVLRAPELHQYFLCSYTDQVKLFRGLKHPWVRRSIDALPLPYDVKKNLIRPLDSITSGVVNTLNKSGAARWRESAPPKSMKL